jgi:hypothetical protein
MSLGRSDDVLPEGLAVLLETCTEEERTEVRRHLADRFKTRTTIRTLSAKYQIRVFLDQVSRL